MTTTEKNVRTSHANIAVRETSGDGLAVLLIHGNSSCKEAFQKQLDSSLGANFRLIAMDLPGHGASSDAFKPEQTYTMPGYAQCAVELLDKMGVKRAAVFGWSLGGHVGMEMLTRYAGLAGLALTGAPPIAPTPESIQAGFRPVPELGLFGKADLTPEEREICVDMSYGAFATEQLRASLKRADGRARALMFQSLFSGATANQRALVEATDLPVALINGAKDPMVNTEYVETLAYKNLWDKHCYLLRGLAHSPFLASPDVFNPILERFFRDVEKSTVKNTLVSRAGAAAA